MPTGCLNELKLHPAGSPRTKTRYWGRRLGAEWRVWLSLGRPYPGMPPMVATALRLWPAGISACRADDTWGKRRGTGPPASLSPRQVDEVSQEGPA